MDAKNILRDHATFRVILQAMSHPGKVYRLPEFAGEETATVELLSCLLDHEVGVAVIGNPALAVQLVRQTACRLVAGDEANFVIIANPSGSADLPALQRGSLEYPDSGATLIYLVDGLSEAEGDIVVSGPGVQGTTALRISGLAGGEIARLRQLNSEFPLGVDAIFFVPRRNGRIACIPRSSRIGAN